MRRLDIPVLTTEEIQALSTPTGSALGLPGRAYFSDAFYELERRRLFAEGWVGAGFASELPNVGDSKSVSLAGWELLLVRSADGQIRCFHNVCRHRGMKLVEGRCSGTHLQCPYHSWTYELDGRLCATPAIAGSQCDLPRGMSKRGLGLLPVRCELWFDVVFINIDQNALPLSEHLQPAINRMGRRANMSIDGRSTFDDVVEREVAANWKIVAESVIEDYHGPFLNRSSSHSSDYSTEDGGNVFAGFSSRRSFEDAARLLGSELNGVRLPSPSCTTRIGTVETLVLLLFPNTIVTCGVHGITLSLIFPTGPQTSKIGSVTHFHGEASGDEYEPVRMNVSARRSCKFDEMSAIWGALQSQTRVREELGLATRFSSHWERGLHLFQLYVVEKLFQNKLTESGSP